MEKKKAGQLVFKTAFLQVFAVYLSARESPLVLKYRGFTLPPMHFPGWMPGSMAGRRRVKFPARVPIILNWLDL
ncbi:MAG: hypothetical protein ACRECJ_08910 [Limisphaerales bacterium]